MMHFTDKLIDVYKSKGPLLVLCIKLLLQNSVLGACMELRCRLITGDNTSKMKYYEWSIMLSRRTRNT